VTTVEVIGLIVVCIFAAAFILVVLHQRRLIASGGALPLAVRRAGSRWSNGVGRYSPDELVWYRTLTLSPFAAMRMPRAELSVVRTRAWDAVQDLALRPNLMVVEFGLSR
jgi:hypothetical protein